MTTILPRPGQGPAAFECAYNLFQYSACDLLCAVPESRPVPGFIREPVWQFVGKLQDTEAAPTGFNEQAAQTGVRYNGFHLFVRAVRARHAPKEVVVVGVVVPTWEGSGSPDEPVASKRLNDNTVAATGAAVGSC
jgi:hypothetical protein